VLAVITAGDRGASFEPRGLNGDLEELFFPFLHGTAWYTGMRPLRPHLVSGVDRPGWDQFDQEVERLRERIAGLATEEPIRYRALSDGDYGRDRRLRPGPAAASRRPAGGARARRPLCRRSPSRLLRSVDLNCG